LFHMSIPLQPYATSSPQTVGRSLATTVFDLAPARNPTRRSLHQKRRAATSPPLAQELIAQTLGIPQPVVKSAADFFIEPVLPRPPNHLDRHPIIRGVVHPLAKLNSDPLTISQKTDTHLMRIGCCLLVRSS
jgi:hypothetical protein